jgi:hypothetical protein
LDAPPLGAMARLRSPSLFHTVTEHPAMLFVAMFVRRVGCDGLYVLRRKPEKVGTTELQGSGLFEK